MNLSSEEEEILAILVDHPGISIKQIAVELYKIKNNIDANWWNILQILDASEIRIRHVMLVVKKLEQKGFIKPLSHHSISFKTKCKNIYSPLKIH